MQSGKNITSGSQPPDNRESDKRYPLAKQEDDETGIMRRIPKYGNSGCAICGLFICATVGTLLCAARIMTP